MSATLRLLDWSVVVEDIDHWTAEHVAAADAEPGGGYDDWVVDQLRDSMHEAGQRFIQEYPDLFRGDLV